jgi:hypothetical protein
MVSYGHRYWRYHRHRDFSGRQRHGTPCRLRCTCFRGMTPRWVHCASRCFLLCRTGCGISKSRRPLRLPKPWSQSSLGISLRLDELASRAASRHGHPGGWVRTVSRLLVPSGGHAFVHKSSRALRVHFHHGATVSRIGSGGCDRHQLLQCADEWRDSRFC